jgi:hypothetical protein
MARNRSRRDAVQMIYNFLVRYAAITPTQEGGKTSPPLWRGIAFHQSSVAPSAALTRARRDGTAGERDIIVLLNSTQRVGEAHGLVPMPLLAELLRAYDDVRRGDTE